MLKLLARNDQIHVQLIQSLFTEQEHTANITAWSMLNIGQIKVRRRTICQTAMNESEDSTISTDVSKSSTSESQ